MTLTHSLKIIDQGSMLLEFTHKLHGKTWSRNINKKLIVFKVCIHCNLYKNAAALHFVFKTWCFNKIIIINNTEIRVIKIKFEYMERNGTTDDEIIIMRDNLNLVFVVHKWIVWFVCTVTAWICERKYDKCLKNNNRILWVCCELWP